MGFEKFSLRIPKPTPVFDSNKEVGSILALPSEERPEALELFKSKLADQKEAWAQCRLALEEYINENPISPRRKLVKIIKKFSFQHGFTKEQIVTAELIVDDYISKHKEVVKLRREIPNDIDLVNKLFGMEFNQQEGKDFRVVVKTAYFEIYCGHLNTCQLHEESMEPNLIQGLGGFKGVSDEGIVYTVINTDNLPENESLYQQSILHERQHVINELLRIVFINTRFDYFFANRLLFKFYSEKGRDKKLAFFREYLLLKRGQFLDEVKDELVAHLRHQELSVKEAGELFGVGQEYDYPEDCRALFKKVTRNRALIENLLEKLLTKEYIEIIEKAIVAFNKLVESGYSLSKAIALFSNEPLQKWPKVVRRLLEQKNKREEN